MNTATDNNVHCDSWTLDSLDPSLKAVSADDDWHDFFFSQLSFPLFWSVCFLWRFSEAVIPLHTVKRGSWQYKFLQCTNTFFRCIHMFYFSLAVSSLMSVFDQNLSLPFLSPSASLHYAKSSLKKPWINFEICSSKHHHAMWHHASLVRD